MGETICAPTGNDPLNPWCGCGQKIGEPVTSICLSCLRPAHAYKIRSEDTPPRIYLVRECYNPGCMQNGEPLITSSRISSDAEFFWVLDKNNSCCGNGTCEMPLGGNVKGGNMSDLHGCTYVVDIIEECNLSCPTCYADAPHTSSGHTKQMSLKVFQKMILERIEKQGKIDIVQLSGGEPTLHPQLFEFVSWLGSLEAVADTLLNTNGVKLADPGFVQALAQHAQKGKFSVYLQYDGVMPEGQVTLRGGDYRSIRERALKNLEEYEIPVCLTMAVTHENLEFCWNTLDRALHNDNIRWVTFQPEFLSGRNDPQKLAEQPVSVAHIVHALNEKAQGVVNLQSFMPLPCSHPNCGTVGFVVRVEGKWHSVTTFVDLKNLTPFLENRMNFDIVDDVTKCGCDNYDLQKIMVQAGIHPNDIKMIFVKPFMDARTWDSERIKSCCTHVLYQNTQGETVVDSFCRHYANKGKIPL